MTEAKSRHIWLERRRCPTIGRCRRSFDCHLDERHRLPALTFVDAQAVHILPGSRRPRSRLAKKLPEPLRESSNPLIPRKSEWLQKPIRTQHEVHFGFFEHNQAHSAD